jgi:hypothetical protein
MLARGSIYVTIAPIFAAGSGMGLRDTTLEQGKLAERDDTKGQFPNPSRRITKIAFSRLCLHAILKIGCRIGAFGRKRFPLTLLSPI